MTKYIFILLISFCSLQPPAVAHSDKINIVVNASLVSNKGIEIYQDITTYIGKQLNRNVQMISGINYQETTLLIEQGIIQIGFICGLPYTQLRAANKVKLIAIPVIAPKKTASGLQASYQQSPGKYYSYTIAHKDSAIESWEDLKGKSYAYNDKHSNSGYNMPRYKLTQLGARSWQEYFSRIEVSGSHEKSIQMVARGLVDASSVDSLVLDFDRHIKDPDALNVKIIETLFPGGAGTPPVIVSSKINPELLSQLKTAFIRMHETEEGRTILERALLSRFAPPDDHNYDDIRAMEQAAQQVGFRDDH